MNATSIDKLTNAIECVVRPTAAPRTRKADVAPPWGYDPGLDEIAKRE